MKKQIIIVVALVAGFCGQSFAQMTKPSFGPERAKLSFLIGHFTTKTNIMMGDNSSADNGTIKAHWGLDSMFVLYSSEETNQAFGSYKSLGVLGYDADNNQYVLKMFNNFGSSPEYKGTFSGDTLMLNGKIESPQGTLDQKMEWFKDGSKVRLQIYGDFGQGYTLFVDQTATPVSDATK